MFHGYAFKKNFQNKIRFPILTLLLQTILDPKAV